jgi:tetratricopeptide (TPR) repeat protein
MHAKKLTHYFIALVIVAVMSPWSLSAQSQKEVEADTLVGRQDYAGALALYNKIIEKSKPKTEQEYQLYYKRAVCYYSLENFQEALSDINRVIEKYPTPQAKLLRAYIFQELEDYEAQLSDINELVSLNPNSAELLQWRASVLMEAEKYEDAQRDIRKLLESHSGPDLKSYLGLTYYYLDNPDSALLIFDEVISEAPEHTQVYLYAASLCLEQDAYELALTYINKGLRVEPENISLLFYKGIALVETGQDKEGCRCLTKAFDAGLDDVADYLKQYCYSNQ